MRILSLPASSRHGVLARGVLLVLAVVHLTCNQAILTAPEGSTLFVDANPKVIPAFGGVSVVSARVFEKVGTPVADGTVVQFFTDLGRIPEQAKTNDGVARVNLVADSLSGEATITAFSGGVKGDAVKVRIGGGIPPAKMLISANPLRLVERRASTITVTVVDADGNPIPNIAVFFSISNVEVQYPPTPAPTPIPSPIPPPTPAPSPTPKPPERDEFMESRGSPVFTDNNGRATDVMRTERPLDAIRYVVTVKAELAVSVGTGRTDGVEIDVYVN